MIWNTSLFIFVLFFRYINHSCAPNCVAEVVTFERGYKIIISCGRRIDKGEEVDICSLIRHLTYAQMSISLVCCSESDVSLPVFQLCFDYQFDTVDSQHKIACHCGAPECRKWINWGETTNLNAFLAIECGCFDLCRLHTKVILWMSRRPGPFGEIN